MEWIQNDGMTIEWLNDIRMIELGMIEWQWNHIDRMTK